MKKILLILFTLLLICILAYRYCNNPTTIINRFAQKNTTNQQYLKYRVYLFGLIPVGEAVLNKEKAEEFSGKKAYRINATADNLAAISKFFTVHAEIDSYVDKAQLTPLLFKQKIKISGKPNNIKEVAYNQDENYMSINNIKRQILPNTHDPLSIMLNLKNMDLNKLTEIDLNLNTNQKNYAFKGTVAPAELKINGKSYETFTLKAQVFRRDKNPYHRSNITITLLKENQINTPILIKVFASGALITARLTE